MTRHHYHATDQNTPIVTRCCRSNNNNAGLLSSLLFLISLWSLLPRQSEAFTTPTTGQAVDNGIIFSQLQEVKVQLRQRRLMTELFQASSSSIETEKQRRKSNNQSKNNNASKNKQKQPQDPRQLERTIVELGRKGLTEEALTIYFSIPQPTVRLMNGAIDACARARPTRLDQAFDILSDSTKSGKIKPNVFTFGALMSACARARRGDKARALLKSMQNQYGVTPNAVVYSTAIAAVARTNPPQPQVALDLLRDATQKNHLVMNIVGYNAAISACARAGDWQRATHLLQELEQDNNPTSSAEASPSTNANTTTTTTTTTTLRPKPDHVTYGTVLSACEKGEQWDLVLELARRMETQALQLDVLALTSVLKACQQLGLAKEALYYLKEMNTKAASHLNIARKTAGWQRQGAKQPLQGPDPVAYRLAISACARGGAWQEGISLLEDFEQATGQSPDVMAYTAAITGCEYAGEWKRAFGLLDTMRKNGVEPNEVTMAAIIGACAKACAKGGDASNSIVFKETNSSPMPLPQHKALQLLNILKNDDSVVSPNINVYNAAIRVCAEACDLKRALWLLKDLRENGLEPTIVTFGTLMTASERVGSMEGVNTVFRTMKEYNNMEPNEILYGAAISCCRKAGQAERAFLLLRKMIRDGLRPNVATFNTAIVAQVEGGGRPIAGKTEVDSSSLEECMDRAITLYKIMISTTTNNSTTVASHVATQARPNRQTYNLLVRGLASARRPLDAEALLRRMGEAGYVPDVDLYSATVTAYERNGQPLKALNLMESMRADGYDFYEVQVLNAAFKKAVKLVNVVGRGLSTTAGTSDQVERTGNNVLTLSEEDLMMVDYAREDQVDDTREEG